MAVEAGGIISLARYNLSDSVTQGRFSDAAMLLWTQMVQNRMTRRILFPEARITFSTTGYVQEYAGLPEILRTLRVYINGQLIVPTDLQTLEGHQIQLYDQSGQSGAPVAQGGGPPNNFGTASPAWTTQMAMNYPVVQELGYPAPDAVPWHAGQRPRFYFRGGVIGFVPMPLGVFTVCIDCVLEPVPITSDSQVLNMPDSWVETAAWGVTSMALFSDRDSPSGGGKARDDAKAEFENGIKELMADRKRYSGDAPRGPKLLTQRSFYAQGSRRYYGGGGSYD